MTMYRWVPSMSACGACAAMGTVAYSSPPDAPHGNCKCGVAEVSCVDIDGMDAHYKFKGYEIEGDTIYLNFSVTYECCDGTQSDPLDFAHNVKVDRFAYDEMSAFEDAMDGASEIAPPEIECFPCDYLCV